MLAHRVWLVSTVSFLLVAVQLSLVGAEENSSFNQCFSDPKTCFKDGNLWHKKSGQVERDRKERDRKAAEEVERNRKAAKLEQQRKAQDEKTAEAARRAEKARKPVFASSGTGFAVSKLGHIVTNRHVIDGCSEINIHDGTDIVRARVVSEDIRNDLALLKGNFEPSTIFPLSRKNPELMQEIYVAGYPFGKEISSLLKITSGIVSSLSGVGNDFSNVQIDAAIQPGNSGGPIFTVYGNVIGVVVSRLSSKVISEIWGVAPENTNFGIKSTILINLLESNNVRLAREHTKIVSKSELGAMIAGATYYLSCWKIRSQIKK
ncbi:hypothetical protein A9Q83_04170 [Alphaproteobacteria bacterium 46_93_T64]|nr:hypothetical protein A9Q83_04170 [Alphaproteobacteria bacterium 46_93_T64]